MELESESGNGSRFYFNLNLVAASDAGLPGLEPLNEVERLAPGTTVRALVVDDIRENREVLSGHAQHDRLRGHAGGKRPSGA